MREQARVRPSKSTLIEYTCPIKIITPHGLAPMICTALNLADFATPIVDFSLYVLSRY
jgi:hypothetical protein